MRAGDIHREGAPGTAARAAGAGRSQRRASPAGTRGGLAARTPAPAPGSVMRLVCAPREEEGAAGTNSFGSRRCSDYTLPARTARGSRCTGACLTIRITFAPGWSLRGERSRFSSRKHSPVQWAQRLSPLAGQLRTPPYPIFVTMLVIKWHFSHGSESCQSQQAQPALLESHWCHRALGRAHTWGENNHPPGRTGALGGKKNS